MNVTGGDKLAAKLKEMAGALAKARAVRVGFLEDSRYPDGTSTALVAAVNEFGNPAKGRPPRPFFRDMIRKRSKGWPRGIVQALKDEDYDADRALDKTGAVVKGQLQEEINTYVGPPLKPSTIQRKGFDKQLIDTSHMINSVDYRVVKK